jgi:CubicO group peptidase (beta-lactamase class C family)
MLTPHRTKMKVLAIMAASGWASIARAQPLLHFQLAADYSARGSGHAVLVMVDGKVVFERYDNGWTADKPHNLYSGTKTFWGPAVAAMMEDGLIGSLDEPVSETITEWKSDPRKQRITIKQLLDLTAGLVQDVVNLQGDRTTLAPDLFRHSIGVRTITEPGARFSYGPSCYYVLGELMKRKLATRRQTPLQYLEQRILQPIGLRTGEWVHDKAGNPHMPNGAFVSARDWLKLGELLLNKGQYHGRQVIRSDLLRFEGSRANPGYGFTAWLNRPGGSSSEGRQVVSSPTDPGGWIYPRGLPDLYMAGGAGGQRLYIIPSRNVLIVRMGEAPAFNDAVFLGLLFDGRR